MAPGRALIARLAFSAYAAALFVGTHWPALKIQAPGRPDLFVHLAVFGLWGLLLIAAGFFGPVLSRRNLATVLLVGVAYAAVDEGLQAIPWIRRTAALDDYLMNLAGIVLAVLAGSVFLLARRTAAGPGSRIGTTPSPRNAPDT